MATSPPSASWARRPHGAAAARDELVPLGARNPERIADMVALASVRAHPIPRVAAWDAASSSAGVSGSFDPWVPQRALLQRAHAFGARRE